ncbi:MAG: hypothetical protein Q9M14_07445 [Mariprofundaceae bacterium]|nr:hypothetical protein [Mariprofundaceae bacterium]
MSENYIHILAPHVANAELTLQRHATSKITSSDDLHCIAWFLR